MENEFGMYVNFSVHSVPLQQACDKYVFAQSAKVHFKFLKYLESVQKS